MKNDDYYFGHAEGRATPEYIKSVGEGHGALTLGFVGKIDSALAKAVDLLSTLEARLTKLESAK